MNTGVKIGIVGACAAALAATGIGAYGVVHERTSGAAGGDEVTADSGLRASPVTTSPPADADAVRSARAFLDSWSDQRLQEAAGRTDAPTAAGGALEGYTQGLHLRKLRFHHVRAAGPSAVTQGATRVTFDVTADVAGGTWTYRSALAVRRNRGGRVAVHWDKTVLHPGLGRDESLTAGDLPLDADAVQVVASDGRTKLSSFPSLRAMAATIRHNAKPTGGSGGTGVSAVGPGGKDARTLHVFTKGRPPVIRTTIDASLQAVAEKAVGDSHLRGKPTGAVALDWRTGHILAVAHTGTDGDIAINGIKSPGSTMKIITSAALFDQAGLTANSPAPCTGSVVANSQRFHNDPGVRANPGATVAQAFTVSCNTSFIKEGFRHLVHDGDASALHAEAVNVFGMGSWSIGGGVATTDPSIPPDVRGGDQAAQFIGQGKVTATPLFMASVAATVRNGGFEQPVILPGQHQVSAPRPISARTAGYLRSMMRDVAVRGTAAPRLASLVGVGAKTGTAEEADHTNGWLTAYGSRIAAAALVEGGRSGVDSAGYVVRRLLTAR
ncbi:penicillin-binding transpeptidase domain-containing protein [Streptomyces anandii]|uniref:penicillin-binding transpeptidase domain-containing protein n=1 Tax=Streptomyces anandii TaxID=285454 RepID=UPI0036F7A7D6